MVTVTAGALGIVKGAAVPLPVVLVQPPTVWVTVKAPPEVTVIGLVVEAELLQYKVPVAVVEIWELPHKLVTVTAGALGIVNGAAVPLAAKLIQPSTVVWVTVKAPPEVTEIGLVVEAELLQVNVPVAVVEIWVLPHKLVIVKSGVTGEIIVAVASAVVTNKPLFAQVILQM